MSLYHAGCDVEYFNFMSTFGKKLLLIFGVIGVIAWLISLMLFQNLEVALVFLLAEILSWLFIAVVLRVAEWLLDDSQ